MLPCLDPPPPKPTGGWSWYGFSETKYKCPDGYEFLDGSFPYAYAKCNLMQKWEPAEQMECKRELLHSKNFSYLAFCFSARQCLDPVPDEYLGMDVFWPRQNRSLGARVSYTCPFRATATIGTKQIIGMV